MDQKLTDYTFDLQGYLVLSQALSPALLDRINRTIDYLESLGDDEVEALWAQLQQALATKRELARKVAAAQKLKSLWLALERSGCVSAGEFAKFMRRCEEV